MGRPPKVIEGTTIEETGEKSPATLESLEARIEALEMKLQKVTDQSRGAVQKVNPSKTIFV